MLALPVIVLVAASLTAGAAAAGPSVVSTSPGDGSLSAPTRHNGGDNVVTATAVSATFSEPMDPLTLASDPAGTRTTFTLATSAGVSVPGTVALNAGLTKATLTPVAAELKPGTTYTAVISTAAESARGVALDQPVTWTFTTAAVGYTAEAPIDLGGASTFAILTKTGVTNVYASVVNGNVGASPITGAAIGLSCPEVATGLIYSVDAAGPACKTTDATYLTTSVSDMETAYVDAAGRTLPDVLNLGAGEIGGLTLQPGLYKWNTGVSISSDVTLTGGPDDVWIFQISGNLKQASATNVTLAGGARAANVYWQTAGSATLGTTAHFEGTILSKTMIAMKTGASINGRLLAQSAATLQKNAVTLPAE
ncbi:ice-binding family protein [Pengzhenrongella sicca]|uniref:DUF3494 domain-containing protein n=1 Tax=Pengzhenrongella sicca TaxID=2819238 RepID=A0A8A4ZIH9_9MICO|nr:ice-binding family protein [Pengzhenrongella sicca]QTE30813.1 DUF3494 domain-containing protein [Pengzhenrongella sicca]